MSKGIGTWGFKEIINKKKELWYGIYCFILAILFLHLLFPSGVLEKYIIHEANRVYPGLKIKLGEVSLSFPAGIKIKGLGISAKDHPDINVYESNSTTISPGMLSYASGNRKYSFQSSTMGGTISGSLYSENNNEKTGVKANIRFKDIHLGNGIFILPVFTERLECIAEGQINFTGDISSPANGDINLLLELFDGNIKLKNPVSRLSDIGFRKLNLAAEMKNRLMDITSMELAGEGIEASASGTIRFNDNFTANRLDLKGELELSSAFFQGMPDLQKAVELINSGKEDGRMSFNIKGSIEKPLFNFNRR